MNKINSGVYPTMITPYNKDGSVDLGAAEALVEWYWKRGCHGIFAVCMSSEMFKLTPKERILLVKTVKRKVDSLHAGRSGRSDYVGCRFRSCFRRQRETNKGA